ncbi:hypothetical protein BFJ68_g5944 [Fusarium oxysporum]|uniref:Uncharacterized protein n=2 Tax=Fusarium oxysporum TaxID=5507 RepID=A0A420RE63_FUSOX|nr:hypothetical protein BFJ65_g3473 [Fusarium oxysporum f. sp. cepae]RKK57074.1 hypothetical protein BFJ67_g3619 [Fusarium oxysporum f. sp. cepae]RKK59316.1 hypothetical protein BFJ66_g2319 [Fusarium oxysporum f. sp. cepae]RKL15306.1 hypothetical protein BFJ68_g5944 [Fusarium oxysporum]
MIVASQESKWTCAPPSRPRVTAVQGLVTRYDSTAVSMSGDGSAFPAVALSMVNGQKSELR